MKWEKIVDALEKQLVHLLKCDILPSGSYLAGGTSIYLYLKHRLSIDLDFFTPDSFNSEIFTHKMRNCFEDVSVELMEKDTVILFISKEKIKFSLFFFPYELLSETQAAALQDNTTCRLAPMEDIEAMKAIAISQRGSVKDFIDLYYLIKKTGHSFNDILKLVMRKYGVKKEYQYQLKTSFVFFDDAEKEVDNIMMIRQDNKFEVLSQREWEEIKNFFMEFIK